MTRTELDGGITVIADSYQGKPLNSPNDVVVKSDGSIWFTDPHYGIGSNYEGFAAEQELPCNVYRVDPDGTIEAVLTDFNCPNGLAFSPDETLLYVADTGRMYQVIRRTFAAFLWPRGGRKAGASLPQYQRRVAPMASVATQRAICGLQRRMVCIASRRMVI